MWPGWTNETPSGVGRIDMPLLTSLSPFNGVQTMKLHRSDCIVARSRSFTSWQEIIEAVRARREHLKRVMEERKEWFKLQQSVGMEE